MTITDLAPSPTPTRPIDLREDERRSLRRDLHDSFGPSILGLRLAIDSALKRLDSDPQGSRATIEAVHDELRRLGEHVRLFSHSLLPPELEEGDLAGALATLARRFGTDELRVTIEVEPSLRIERTAQSAIYHVVGEALTNVHRHARASRCDIRLFGTATGVELSVTDDGIGIGVRRGSAGVGTLSMHERIEQLGGVLSVGPRDHAVRDGESPGTQLRAFLPYSDG